jgi:hypothetical protein
MSVKYSTIEYTHLIKKHGIKSKEAKAYRRAACEADPNFDERAKVIERLERANLTLHRAAPSEA